MIEAMTSRKAAEYRRRANEARKALEQMQQENRHLSERDSEQTRNTMTPSSAFAMRQCKDPTKLNSN